MGLFGGSSQSTSSSSNVMDFNPVINIGENNSSSLDKQLDQTSTLSPSQKDDGWSLSAAASAGVALAPYSSASGGTAQLEQTEDLQPIETTTATGTGLSSVNPIYLIGGLVAIGGLIYSMKK